MPRTQIEEHYIVALRGNELSRRPTTVRHEGDNLDLRQIDFPYRHRSEHMCDGSQRIVRHQETGDAVMGLE
ncbi:hypothetical protein D3C86_1909030 [compost metagenome]